MKMIDKSMNAINKFRKHIIEDDNHKFELIQSCNTANTWRDSDNIVTSKYIFNTLDECLSSEYLFKNSSLGDWIYNEDDNTLENQEFCSYGSYYIIKNIVKL